MADTVSHQSTSEATVANALELPGITKSALEFEKTTWAQGSVSDDSVYTVPADASKVSPGTLLKVEPEVDLSNYTIPPSLALSRILFQSENLKGVSVPVSAYVLWPYSPRSQPDGYSVVAFAHGTSGIFPNAAPSHLKNLWQHFLVPYPLAYQGYVVVAPDYAGLGVEKDERGNEIIHEYLASPSHANDLLYAVQAAHSAFRELSKQFVVIGHSQGGGAAWALAEKHAKNSIDGYLGAVAISPATSVLAQPMEGNPIPQILGLALIRGICSMFPDFAPDDILSAEGTKRFEMVSETRASSPTQLTLLFGPQLLKDDWTQNQHVKEFQKLIQTGGKEIAGPLLVIHGESDPLLRAEVTSHAVEETVEKFPSSQIEYVLLRGITHVPALLAAQQLWLRWIGDRFAGVEAQAGVERSVSTPARPISSYQPELNWFIETATFPYQKE